MYESGLTDSEHSSAISTRASSLATSRTNTRASSLATSRSSSFTESQNIELTNLARTPDYRHVQVNVTVNQAVDPIAEFAANRESVTVTDPSPIVTDIERVGHKSDAEQYPLILTILSWLILSVVSVFAVTLLNPPKIVVLLALTIALYVYTTYALDFQNYKSARWINTLIRVLLLVPLIYWIGPHWTIAECQTAASVRIPAENVWVSVNFTQSCNVTFWPDAAIGDPIIYDGFGWVVLYNTLLYIIPAFIAVHAYLVICDWNGWRCTTCGQRVAVAILLVVALVVTIWHVWLFILSDIWIYFVIGWVIAIILTIIIWLAVCKSYRLHIVIAQIALIAISTGPFQNIVSAIWQGTWLGVFIAGVVCYPICFPLKAK